MAKATSTAPANGNTNAMHADLPDFSKFVKEDIQLPPYWTPAPGKWFYAAPVGVDNKGDFPRVQFLSYMPLECQRGPGDEADAAHEKVMIDAGDKFSISVYAGLLEALETYMSYSEATGKPVPIRLTAQKTIKTANQPKFWVWEVLVEPETSAALKAWKKDNGNTAGVLESKISRPALKEANA